MLIVCMCRFCSSYYYMTCRCQNLESEKSWKCPLLHGGFLKHVSTATNKHTRELLRAMFLNQSAPELYIEQDQEQSQEARKAISQEK